jgi:hypothetical protein
MLTATMSRIRTHLESAQISAAVLARLSGVPVSTLKEALQGARYLGGPEEARLLTLVVRAAEIVESLRPLTFAKGDVESLRALLDYQIEPVQVRQMVSTIFGREGE